MLTWSLGWTGFLEPISPAQHLDGAVGDHLIGVHVRLGARAGLPDRPAGNGRRACRRSLPAPPSTMASPIFGSSLPSAMLVSAAARLTMPSARTIGERLLLPADLEIAERALRLRAPVAVGGDLDGAEGVGLGAGGLLFAVGGGGGHARIRGKLNLRRHSTPEGPRHGLAASRERPRGFAKWGDGARTHRIYIFCSALARPAAQIGAAAGLRRRVP